MCMHYRIPHPQLVFGVNLALTLGCVYSCGIAPSATSYARSPDVLLDPHMIVATQL